MKKTFPNLALKNALRTVEDPRDRRFITALVYGVVEKKITLDHFLAQCSDKKPTQLSSSVLSLLRMGLYQMFYMQVPASAACNTSVELAKKHGMFHSAGFVNAVLRRCDRERDALLAFKKADFSVRYSISPKLVDLILEQYGKDVFKSMMDGFGTPDTSVYLFHNTKRGSEEEFLKRLLSEGVVLNATDLPHLFCSDKGFSVDSSACFKDGWFHVVGYHSAQAALMLPRDCKTVLDLCAAPGGKTFILAAMCDGTVHSFDVHDHKVSQLRQSAERLHHKNVTVACADASVLNSDYIGTADFVLCDVPCSGLGIMGKKPDIKYKDYESKDFTDLQIKILQNGASYLKVGGRLVYSTCTIDRRENEQLIDRFLKNNNNFSLDVEAIPEGYKVFLPEVGKDGFFIAVLRKAEI